MIRKLTCLALSLAGCAAGAGSAEIEGDVGGLTFRLSTIYAWIDAKEVKPGMGGVETYEARDDPRLFIRLLGAAFDPDSDLRFLGAAEQCALNLENRLHGAMTITVTKFQKVSDGTTLTSPPGNTSKPDDPTVDLQFRFAIEELEKESEFPAQVPRLGTVQAVTLKLDKVGKDPGQSMEGEVELKLQRGDGEPATVLTGTVKTKFAAPLVHERIAEEGHDFLLKCE